jgi:hypothetical protein
MAAQQARYKKKDGALIRVTRNGTEHCYMYGCNANTAKKIIDFYGEKVWVCNPHSDRDGFKS